MRTPSKKKKKRIPLTHRRIKFLRWVADGDKISLDLARILLCRIDYMEWVDDYTILLDIEGLLLPDEESEAAISQPKQPARKYKVSPRRAYKFLAELVQAGWMKKGEAVRVGESAWWSVTQKGSELAGRTYKENDISYSQYQHVWACNFMRLWYDIFFAKEGISTYKIKTERVMGKGKRDEKNPDIHLWFRDTYDVIEVERFNKGLAIYKEIIARYRLYGANRYVYYCPRSIKAGIQEHFKGEANFTFLSLEGFALEDGTKYIHKTSRS